MCKVKTRPHFSSREWVKSLEKAARSKSPTKKRAEARATLKFLAEKNLMEPASNPGRSKVEDAGEERVALGLHGYSTTQS